jgi:phosphoenolpyruvate-protein kinase (PTS system EI component)
MAERIVAGVPAAPGLAVGRVRVRRPVAVPRRAPVAPARRAREAERAARGLDAAAAELAGLAGGLRAAGRAAEAEIVETGALMAKDPQLADLVRTAILDAGRHAPDAILDATRQVAAQLATLDDETLAARAADVRSLGRRAARLCGGPAGAGAAGAAGGAGAAGAAGAPPREEREEREDTVLVAVELGPADVADLGDHVRAVALAAGGVTDHAAVVARARGLPMVVGLGEAVLELAEGQPVAVDGAAGLVVAGPDPARVGAARAAAGARRRARSAAAPARALPAATRDGRVVRVLANVAGPAEVAAALASGAEGVGLLRTELAFLDAAAWPSFEQHRRALLPILGPLAGRTATVRLLDFGGDKTPPFLRGRHERGVRVLLQAPDALAAQLRAVLAAGGDAALRLLVPMVTGPDEVRAVRGLLQEVAAGLPPARLPALGAMVEVPAAATLADRLAAEVDFFSIGTNDLTHYQLGTDRAAPGRAPAHHPAVLRLVDATVRAAHAAGVVVGVCGEAASDPTGLPLLLGLGVDELSVGAARVGAVRAWTRALDQAAARAIATRALDAAGPAEVEALVRPLRALLREGGDAGAEGVEGRRGVVA